MKIKKFDRPTLKAIRGDMDAALMAVAEKYGITLEVGNVSFADTNFRAKLEARIQFGDGELTVAAQDFVNLARSYGFQPEDLGREFSSNGKRFKITGMKPGSSKYPVLGNCVLTGRGYKFPVDRVKRNLEVAK